MALAAPLSHDDIFGTEAVRSARAVDDALRELGPVVKLAREDVTMITRHAAVSDGLKDWQTFSSRSRPWHDATSVRPEILLTDDPPRHTAVRPVIASALSPRALADMAEAFSADAEALVREVKQRSGTVIDAVAAISRPFVYKVLPDLLGLPMQGREHMTAFGHMVWATMGPQNELFHEAMETPAPSSSGWSSAAIAKTSSPMASACRCSWRPTVGRSPRPRPSCSSEFSCQRPRIRPS